MNIEPCPHCYRKVIPMADNTCPSCGKNTQELHGTDPNQTLTSIFSGDHLPPICFHCGLPSQNTKRLRFTLEPQDTTSGGVLATFCAHLVEGFSLFSTMESLSKTVEISLRLPVCRQCRKSLNRIVPEHIDFDAHRIDLVVHQEFRKAIRNSDPRQGHRQSRSEGAH
jgi:hypothetical protein